ncbi:hypothetical protein BJV82DRAFT_625163 [Fennellomyces sp. T-0311]|nr:hypothetical protein BJV82DRAFT_625163 [Fennellomyces sp. T-0311]
MSSYEQSGWSKYAVSDAPVYKSWAGKTFSWNYVLGANQIDADTVETINCPLCCLVDMRGRVVDSTDQGPYYLVNNTHVCGFQSSIHSSDCTTYIPFGRRPIAVLVDVDRGTSNGQYQEMIIPHCAVGELEDWVLHPYGDNPSTGALRAVFANASEREYRNDFTLTFWLLVALFFLFAMR